MDREGRGQRSGAIIGEGSNWEDNCECAASLPYAVNGTERREATLPVGWLVFYIMWVGNMQPK